MIVPGEGSCGDEEGVVEDIRGLRRWRCPAKKNDTADHLMVNNRPQAALPLLSDLTMSTTRASISGRWTRG